MKNQTAIFLPGLLSLIKEEALLKIKRLELQLIHAAFMSRTSLESKRKVFPASTSYQVNSILRML